MSWAAGLMVLALLGQSQPSVYYWRDAGGQTHVTNTPPPPDAVVLESPPPPGVAPGAAARPEPVRQSARRIDQQPVTLSPAQKKAWEAVDQYLASARAAGNRRGLEAVADSLIRDCLWGNGLWAMPALPILSTLLLGLMGWWLALGLRPGARFPLVAGFLLVGLAFGHLFLNAFLYHPQSERLQQNLGLLERHMGTGTTLRPEQRARLQACYQAMDRAADPLKAPWRFPAEVRALREAVKQVMVDP